LRAGTPRSAPAIVVAIATITIHERMLERSPGRVRTAGHALLQMERRIGYMRARWPRPLGTRPPLQLAVCAIFRDEARYLAEWVTFHRLQGVERFWLYDNRSTDDWRSALAPELASGIVTVTSWPDVPGQLSAYVDCLERHRDDARWIAFIDLDEFLFSPTGRSLSEILRSFDSYPGIVVNWRMYGTNGYVEAPAGLVTENYLMRGGDDHPDNTNLKCIVYPRKTRVRQTTPHSFAHPGLAVGEDRRLHSSHRRVPATTDLLRINHYIAKSANDWERKCKRPSNTGWLKVGPSSLLPADEVRDETILQFLPALKAALARRSGV
jgi:Glycosyltransferase family 92